MAKRRDAFPFSNKGKNYTQTPNELFDVQKELLPNAFRVLTALVRATNGWHILFAPLTHADLMSATGIGSRTTMRQCLEVLLEQGLVLRLEAGSGRERKTYYGLASEETYWAYEGVVSGALSMKEAQTSFVDVDNHRVVHTRPVPDRPPPAPSTDPPTVHPAPATRRPELGHRTAEARDTRDREIRVPRPAGQSVPPVAAPNRGVRVARKGRAERTSERVARFLSWVEDLWRSKGPRS